MQRIIFPLLLIIFIMMLALPAILSSCPAASMHAIHGVMTKECNSQNGIHHLDIVNDIFFNSVIMASFSVFFLAVFLLFLNSQTDYGVMQLKKSAVYYHNYLRATHTHFFDSFRIALQKGIIQQKDLGSAA